jgi:hypothetical protein
MASPSQTVTPKGSGIDRRASVRYYPQQVKAGLVSQPKRGRPWKAMIRDLSTTGIGMVLNQSFETGTQLAIELNSPDGLLAYTVLTRVVHATRLPNGSHVVGCSFVRELSEEELRNLL